MRRLVTLLAVIAMCAALAVLVSGCSKNDPAEPVSNIPPETTLSFAPDQGDTVCYLVRMNWFGWDPDGEVTHYLTRWDSLGWTQTVATDSVFNVPADDTTGVPGQAYGRHTFDVKAVDDDGDEDPTPASVTFTALNIFPDTEITHGPSGVGGPYVSFEWIGSDADGSVAGYGYRLSRYEGGGYVEYEAAYDVPPNQTTAEFGPLCGPWRFDVWAVDDNGAADHTPAERSFAGYCGGPAGFDMNCNVLNDNVRWWSYLPGNGRTHVVEMFGGEELRFEWTAEGQGIQYRYAYDDTTEWSGWSHSNDHFEVTPTAGPHELHVAVRDTIGEGLHAVALLEVVDPSLDDYILIVDDYDNFEHNPVWATDEERDAFYDGLVAPFGDRYQWDPSEHLDESWNEMPPDVATLAGASTVIWYCDTSETELRELMEPYGAAYDPLSGYARAGGNILLCGFEPIASAADAPYPVDAAQGGTPGKRFVRDVLRVGYADHSGYGLNPDAPWSFGYCMLGAVPTAAGEALGFEPVYIDSGDCSGEIGRWAFYCDPPPYHGLEHCGIPVERLEAFAGEATEIYGTDSYINYHYVGAPSVVLYLSGDDHGNVCHVGFPLYYMQTEHAEAFVRRVLTLFGEDER